MAKGSSKLGGGGNPLLKELTDNTDFNSWIRENMKNPDFKKIGREEGMEAIRDLWYEKRAQEELKNIHEMDIEDAIDQVKDNVSGNAISGWFRNADSEYKPKLMDQIMQSHGTLNAGLNIAYNNYKDEMAIKGQKPLPFNKWAVTPTTMYRGDRGQKTVGGDIFLSFTRDKKVAAGFTLSDSGGGHANVKDDFSNIDKKRLTTIKIRPIDTWGSYQTTGEQEYLVPIKKVRR